MPRRKQLLGELNRAEPEEIASCYLRLVDWLHDNEISVESVDLSHPDAIAEYHARAVECAIKTSEPAKAHGAVDRAFALLQEVAKTKLTYDDSIEVILSPRIASILLATGIETIGDLCTYSREALSRISQIRFKSIDVIEESLRKHGFELLQ